MAQLVKKWQDPSPITPEAERSLGSHFSPIFRQVLYSRGIEDIETAAAYLAAEPPPGCDRPGDLLDMPAAVARIRRALAENQLIAVYGDYDADGVTAAALLTLALRDLGGRVRPYIPDRFEEGYGLNVDALDRLKAEGVSLVITVDCGVRSIAEAVHAAGIGLDLIITDHHLPGQEIPPATAVIDPKRPGDPYPDKDLAGVGLAYKLVCALAEAAAAESGRPPLDPETFLDLVALGTIADMAPLSGENRSLVRRGIRQMQRPARQGVMSLIGVCNINASQLTSEHIGFMLGPRLNAAGRLETAQNALELLLSNEPAETGRLAQLLSNQNYERQKVTREIQEHALQLALAEEPDPLLLFAADPGYNSGVIGLAASRLTEVHYRPAIVAALGEDYTRGSCRSIPEFHISDALDACADLLVRHGGHAAAAGFTVRTADLAELKKRLRRLAAERLDGQDLQPSLRSDAAAEISDMDERLMQELEMLQPTGMGNPPAQFISRGVQVVQKKPVGSDKSHLKLTVTDGRLWREAIAFRLGHLMAELPKQVDLLYRLEWNAFNGQRSLQLNVKDIRW